MGDTATFCIVGANATGASAAAALREGGFDGRLILIGDDPHAPYERPPLSKERLRGEQVTETWLRPDGYWSEQEIDARFGERVSAIDAASRTVTTTGGDAMAYDRLLLTTGVRNRDLRVPGADLDGIYDLRTPEDAERIRKAALAHPGGKAVVVGFGFIGAEVAASLRAMGIEVEIVEIFFTALERILGPRFGRVLEGIHRDHGVVMYFDDSVERFAGAGRVEEVVTEKGRRIGCDFAVVGIGTVPNDELAAAAGIGAERGITVDPSLRTDVAGVYAAGDVANHDHPIFGRIRVEHFDNAQKMGEHVAQTMLADQAAGGVATDSPAFADPHWFWSDQYDTNIQMAGFTLDWPQEQLVVRGSEDARDFVAFRLGDDGAVRACLGVNRPRDVRRSLKLIAAQTVVQRQALADPEVDLRSLVEPTS